MGDNVLAIASLRNDVIQKLRRVGVLTLELVAQPNIEAILEAKEGDLLFLTDESCEDVKSGVRGIIVQIVRKDVGWSRLRNLPEYDEREILRARIQVKFMDIATVKRVIQRMPLSVEVNFSTHVIVG